MTVDIENSVVKFSFLYCPVVSFNCNVGAELKQWVFWVALLNQMSILESKSASVPPWRAGRMHKLCLRGKSGQPRASGGSSDRCQLHPPSLEGTAPRAWRVQLGFWLAVSMWQRWNCVVYERWCGARVDLRAEPKRDQGAWIHLCLSGMCFVSGLSLWSESIGR